MLWAGNSGTHIHDSNLYSNKALKRGSVTYLTGTSSIVINASHVYDNNFLEADAGGVIHPHSNDGHFVGLYHGIFYNNSAQIGGVLSKSDDNPEGCMATVEKSFHKTFTSFLQASIRLQKHSLIVVLSSLFDTNHANITGGVFSIQNMDNITVTIKRSKFLKSVA